MKAEGPFASPFCTGCCRNIGQTVSRFGMHDKADDTATVLSEKSCPFFNEMERHRTSMQRMPTQLTRHFHFNDEVARAFAS